MVSFAFKAALLALATQMHSHHVNAANLQLWKENEASSPSPFFDEKPNGTNGTTTNNTNNSNKLFIATMFDLAMVKAMDTMSLFMNTASKFGRRLVSPELYTITEATLHEAYNQVIATSGQVFNVSTLCTARNQIRSSVKAMLPSPPPPPPAPPVLPIRDYSQFESFNVQSVSTLLFGHMIDPAYHEFSTLATIDPCKLEKFHLGFPYGVFAERFFKTHHVPICQLPTPPPAKPTPCTTTTFIASPIRFLLDLVFYEEDESETASENIVVTRHELNSAIQKWLSDEQDSVFQWLYQKLALVQHWSSTKLDSAKQWIWSGLTSLKNRFEWRMQAIWQLIVDVMQAIRQWIGTIMQAIQQRAVGTLRAIQQRAVGTLQTIKDFATTSVKETKADKDETQEVKYERFHINRLPVERQHELSHWVDAEGYMLAHRKDGLYYLKPAANSNANNDVDRKGLRYFTNGHDPTLLAISFPLVVIFLHYVLHWLSKIFPGTFPDPFKDEEAAQGPQQAASPMTMDAALQQVLAVLTQGGHGLHYRVLGISLSASQAEIKRAYLGLARKVHPDKNRATGAIEAIQAVNLAFEILSDVERRSLYDQSGQYHAPPVQRQRQQPVYGYGPGTMVVYQQRA